ncbi:hypothetical protein Pla52n_24590 [Stieleria varia]|uniref:Uncharacterized protein n=1 Tax=Stieleria varia TaxID=2528005 RepID=A0A5C6AXQ8_9BACT|nr:hypothetical protein Pla52n_59180 [Stieleria varia]TWU04418.1 hypothetical protein Pla52n_24590 [Stieleria varia]
MGVNLWGAASFGKPVPCTNSELETKDSIPNVIFQDEVLGAVSKMPGNCAQGDKPWGGSLRCSIGVATGSIPPKLRGNE